MDSDESALKRLDALVGTWEVRLTLPTDPPMAVQAQATFEWLPGNMFLRYRSGAEGSDFPRGESIIGSDDGMGTHMMLYSDSRGVTRIYAMSLKDGVWMLWRDDPSFAQRFTGTFSEDGRTIIGQWEFARDGVTWEHDFDLTYSRL